MFIALDRRLSDDGVSSAGWFVFFTGWRKQTILLVCFNCPVRQIGIQILNFEIHARPQPIFTILFHFFLFFFWQLNPPSITMSAILGGNSKHKKQGKWVTFVLRPAFPCFRCSTKARARGYRQATDEMWDATIAFTFTFWTESDKPELQMCFISFTFHFHGCWYNNVWISILVNCIVNTQYHLCMCALAMEE